MEQERNFQELITGVRAGDQTAITEIYDRYKEYIKRVANTKLLSTRMRTLYQSDDIVQTVMKSFLIRFGAPGNQWQLDTPEKLIGLLMTMANNKIADKSRELSSAKSGGGVEPRSIDAIADPSDQKPTPDDIAANKELASLCWDQFGSDLRALYEMRIDHQMTWSEIGQECFKSGDACRKDYERGLNEIKSQFIEKLGND